MHLFMRSDAHVSDCGTYRWWLSRVWDDSLPVVCWIMLNPSTADARQDDPTIRRVVDFSRRWGAGAAYVVNLFALRATDPRELKRHPEPVGENNDWAIRCNAGAAPGCVSRLAVVAAWGVGGTLHGRDRQVAAILRDHGVRLSCLGVTSSGHPRHPLYVRADTTLVDLPECNPERKVE